MMPVILDPGMMDRQIVIEQVTETEGADYRDRVESWSTFAAVDANVFSGPGREFDSMRQINAAITTQFHIRWISGLSVKMRILYDGKYYDIFQIQEVGRRERINLWAIARQT